MTKSVGLATVALTFALLATSFEPAAGAPVGSEFQVNSYTTYSQRDAAVGPDGAGGFVVAWHSSNQDGNLRGVFAQRFDSAGAPAGSEFQVNSYTANDQYAAAVAPDGAGGFVVAWTSVDQDGNLRGVFAQRFDSAGSPAGSEFQVNTYTTSSQRAPAVAPDGAGGFVIAWSSAGNQDGGAFGIFAQRFDSAGSPAGSEFQANSYTSFTQDDPAVAPDGAGGFVVAWISSFQDGNDTGIFAQRFDSAGSPAGSEFQVNSYTTYAQYDPSVAPDGAGGFVVAWDSQDDYDIGFYFGVYAQRFDSAGSPAGSEFQVNSYTTNNQRDPAVAPDGAGGFVVAWFSYDGQDGSNRGVFAQRFDSAGSPAGSEFQINSYTAISQRDPAVAPDGAGGFVVAWFDGSQDGNSYGVFAQRFAEPAATATSTATETTTASATATETATATVTNTPTPASGSAAVCPAIPAVGCNVPTKGKLIIKDNADSTKDKLVWKFGKGPLLAQADFGNPVTTDGYAFCVYDDGVKKIDLTIPSGAPWEMLSTKGYQYKDSAGANDGVTKVKLLGGDAGKSKLQLKGKGAGLAVPLPASMTQLLSGAVSVVVQLHGNGDCWETSFTSLQSTHKANSYKGKF